MHCEFLWRKIIGDDGSYSAVSMRSLVWGAHQMKVPKKNKAITISSTSRLLTADALQGYGHLSSNGFCDFQQSASPEVLW